MNHSSIYSFTHSQDRQVREWIRILMRDGQAAIDQFIASENPKQRLLAEQYQMAMNVAEEERLAHA